MACATDDLRTPRPGGTCPRNVCCFAQILEARDVAYEGENEDVSSDASVEDVEWTASDKTAHVAGCERRIETVKALGLPWAEG